MTRRDPTGRPLRANDTGRFKRPNDTGRFKRPNDTGRFKRPTGRFRLFGLFGRGRNRRLHEPTWRADDPTPTPAGEVAPRKKRKAATAPSLPRWARPDLLQLRAIFTGAALLLLKVVFLAGVVAGTSAAGYFGYRQLLTSDHFTVKVIRVEGNQRASGPEVHKLIKDVLGRQMFTLELAKLQEAAAGHAWVHKAEMRRELPATLVVKVTEHEPRALLLLGHLYLVNGEGEVFKRATTEETEGLPVVTGIKRLDYMNAPKAQAPLLKRALDALALYREEQRPPLSEVNVGEQGQVTLYMRRGGAALRFGKVMNKNRLSKLDAVLAALGPKARRVRVVYLDNEARQDRVTVRMNQSD